MRTLGRRVVDIDADCARLHGELADLVKATAPSLLRLPGVGPIPPPCCWSPPAITPAGSAPRPPSPTSAASLRFPPHPARSRHRLNPGGNRQANHALWRIVFTRMSSDPRTPATSNGAPPKASKPEIIRGLKRSSPARCFATSRACNATNGAGGLAHIRAATSAGLRTICRPRSHLLDPTSPGLIRACPRGRAAHHCLVRTAANSPLTNIGASFGVGRQCTPGGVGCARFGAACSTASQCLS